VALFPNPPAWAANTAYLAGIHEVTAGSLIYLCTRSGTSGGSAPTWPSTFNASVSDGTCAWTCVQNARAAWQANHAYTAGAANNAATAPYPWPDQVVEDSDLGLWECAVSGTSGGSAPSWAPWSFSTVTDGGVVWTAVSWTDEEGAWRPGQQYPLGAMLATAGVWWKVTTAGTSGTYPGAPYTPNWPGLYAPNLVTDGSVQWALVAYNDE
jgi:hypothetical protein